MTLTDLVLASSWPPRRDAMVCDANWILWVRDSWRVALLGMPSVFA